jgi:LAO/AO transport system kinase
MSERVDRARQLDKSSLGKLVSLFEDSRPEAARERQQVVAELEANTAAPRAVFVGITGTPGAGKSSLIGEIALRLIRADPDVTVAVVAVDPTSHVSGGALLGDRTRVRFPADEDRLFFRSQATDLELGGVSRNTFSVARLLYRLFDIVFIETVGIGQSEVEIRHIADWTYLVLQPLGGDQVQFMKAGIMEIPDALILNKCDERQAAEATYSALRSSSGIAAASELSIHRTSAKTGEGVDQVVAEVLGLRGRAAPSMRDKEAYFFEKWLRDQYGQAGMQALHSLAPSAIEYISTAGSFDEAQMAFAARAVSG